MREYMMVCNGDNSVAVFDNLDGAPRRTIIGLSCSRCDDSLRQDLMVLRQAGYHRVITCHAGPELLSQWEREGYRLLVDPVLTPTDRISGVEIRSVDVRATQDALS